MRGKIHFELGENMPICLTFSKAWLRNRWKRSNRFLHFLTTDSGKVTCKKCLWYNLPAPLKPKTDSSFSMSEEEKRRDEREYGE